jgi:hypothetical protein
VRKASFVLAIAACAASSLSLAQDRDPPADGATPATTANADAESGDNQTPSEKSGFGQIMSMLTGLLQEAAAKQATSGSSDAPLSESSDQSAVTISVTPVAGRSTFYVDKPQRSRSRRANATPPARVAATNIEASAAKGAQVAMQAENNVPD